MNLRLIWNMTTAYISFPYWFFWCRKRFLREPWCGFECDWVFPYGFVPEAGCPVHDNDEEMIAAVSAAGRRYT